MKVTVKKSSIKFKDIKWSGLYKLTPTRLWDSAVRFTKDMYVGGDALQVISLQYKKKLSLGRGGIILTNDKDAYEWLKLNRFHGRRVGTTQFEDDFAYPGWNMYMIPADAARAILLFDELDKVNPDIATESTYPDLSKKSIYRKYNEED